jgi:hypothetical protein
MPANRNDITKKPIMTDTTTRDSWTAVDRMGKFHVIWADSKQDARIHAIEQGWSLVNDYKELD